MMAQITTKVERITPTRAAKYLEGNTHNRPLKESLVRRLAHALRAGHWRQTHQGIAFGLNGKLLDGQHRLTAIARTGIPARIMVTRGLDEGVFEAIDTGAARTAGDHFALLGYTNTNILAAALALEHRNKINAGDMSRKVPHDDVPDKTDLVELAEQHPRLVEIAQSYQSKQATHLLTPSWWSWLCYNLEIADDELAPGFLESLRTGANLQDGSIVLKTRDRMERIGREILSKKRQGPHAQIERAALAIKAWNAVRDGDEMKPRQQVIWRSMGQSSEPFPVPR